MGFIKELGRAIGEGLEYAAEQAKQRRLDIAYKNSNAKTEAEAEIFYSGVAYAQREAAKTTATPTSDVNEAAREYYRLAGLARGNSLGAWTNDYKVKCAMERGEIAPILEASSILQGKLTKYNIAF